LEERVNEEKRVLIVEDESVVALMLQESLTRIGYCVVGVCFRGEDAVRMAADTHPDVVIMDINLKGEMDGISASEAILSSMDIPVIYLTAYTDDDTIRRAALTDSHSYLVKPINMRELFANIEMAIHKKRRAQANRETAAVPAPACPCGATMVCTFAPQGTRMVVAGWICPACREFRAA